MCWETLLVSENRWAVYRKESKTIVGHVRLVSGRFYYEMENFIVGQWETKGEAVERLVERLKICRFM